VVRVSDVSHRPTPLASGTAILLCAVGTAVFARTLDQRLAIVGVVLGVGLLLADGRGQAQLQWLAAGVVILASLGWGLALSDPVRQVELLPGLVGTVFVGLGVRPVSERFARRFVSAGLAALVVGVALVGIFEQAGPLRLLAGTALAVAAWDIAEHGISLGEQLRTDADTRSVELLHSGATLGYGAVLIYVATVLFENGATGLPLAALVLLLVAAVTLMGLLYS